jgi:putative ABC transport system substrate-binding protein
MVARVIEARTSGSRACAGARARRAALALAAGMLGFVAFHADAQDARRPYRIGAVTEAWAADHPTVLGLKAGLRELGLEEGRDVTFDVRFSEGRPGAMTTAARALVDAGVDLLFCAGVASTRAAKAATGKLPIVFAQVNDPVAAGVVTELVRPGGNVTGVSGLAVELTPKRLQILKTLQPDVRRVWIIHARDDLIAAAAFARVRESAPLLGVDVMSRAVSGAGELDGIRRELRRGDALLAPDGDALDLPAGLLKLSLAARVPAIFPSSFWVGYGGLVSYGPDYFAQGMQAARLVAKILGGTPPGELPVEGADVIDLAVNLGTAGAMNIDVPRKILLRAGTIRR